MVDHPGIVWRKLFSVDVPDAQRQGSSQVEIKVTTFVVNRLIGDQQPDVVK
jgi:hypothetical protein